MIDSDSTSSTVPTSPSQGHELLPVARSAVKRDSAATEPSHAIASYEAFLRDLPALLQSHPGQCAAYQDGVFWGIGPARPAFFQDIYAKGADLRRMLFFTVEPQVPHEVELLTPEWDTV